MDEVSEEFLLALAGIAATLVGTFIVAVFFYLDSALHRERGAAGSAADEYMRAGARWVLIAYSLPMVVAPALVGLELAWAAAAFLVFAAALVVATVDTSRRVLKKGATRKSSGLAANEILTSLTVVVLVILPWILGGQHPSPSDFVPSLLLALAIGFTSTATVIMSVFGASGMMPPAAEPTVPQSGADLRARSIDAPTSSQERETTMTVRLLNPEDHISIPLYHHVAIATGNTHVYLAGQVAWDENGRLVADDLAGQVAQVYRNVAKGLAAAGATFHDVVRFTWYVVHWEPSMYDDFLAGVEQASREFDLPRPPLAAIGVDILFEPGILVEAEVTAVVDRPGSEWHGTGGAQQARASH